MTLMTNQEIFSLASLIIALLTLLGIGGVMKHFWDDKHQKREENKQEAKERAKKERQEEIKEVVLEVFQALITPQMAALSKEITEIKTEVAEIKKEIAELKEGQRLSKENEIRLDRIIMKITLDIYIRQGYISTSDRAAWKEIYDVYKDLGGNHFKEYVDEWKKAIYNLPTKNDIKSKKEVKTK